MSQESESDRARYRLDDSVEPSREHDERVLQAFGEAGREIAGRRRRQRRRVRWFAIPATLAAALVLVPFLLPEHEIPLRNGTGQQSVEPANAAMLDEAPERLQWTAQADARSYRVTVYGLDDEVVYSAEIPHPANTVELPPASVASMQPGETYYWLVEVEGAVSAEIGPFWFSVGEAAEETDR